MEIVNKIKQVLGLESLQEKLDRYTEVSKSYTEVESELDQLSKTFFIEKSRYVRRLAEPENEEIQDRIKAKWNKFLEYQREDIRKSKKKFDSLRKEKEKIESDERIQKALKEISKSEQYEKLKKAYQNQQISPETYNTIIKALTDSKKVKYADFILFNEDGKLLLLKRSAWEDDNKGAWVIPGGHVDPGEDFETAAKRELREESGYNVDKCENVGSYEDDKCHIEYFQSYINTKEQQMVLDVFESRDYRWINLDELDEYEMVFNMKDNLVKILKLPTKQKEIIRKTISKSEVEDLILKGIDHKYIRKEPDGKGGWNYLYEEDDNRETLTKDRDDKLQNDLLEHYIGKNWYKTSAGGAGGNKYLSLGSFQLRIADHSASPKHKGEFDVSVVTHENDPTRHKFVTDNLRVDGVSKEEAIKKIDNKIKSNLIEFANFSTIDNYQDLYDYLNTINEVDRKIGLNDKEKDILFKILEGKKINEFDSGEKDKVNDLFEEFEEIIPKGYKLDLRFKKESTERKPKQQIEDEPNNEEQVNRIRDRLSSLGLSNEQEYKTAFKIFKNSTPKVGEPIKSEMILRILSKVFAQELNINKSEKSDIIKSAILQGIIPADLIEKAKSGVYKNTPENRKFSRVGQKYGDKEEEQDYLTKVKQYAEQIITGQHSLKRLSPEEEQGRLLGGKRNVEASIIAGANEKSSKTAETKLSKQEQERRLKLYAQKENIWFSHPSNRVDEFINNTTKLSNDNFIDSGGEANVYRLNKGIVAKINYYPFEEEPAKFLDRITLHNYLFPESLYEVIGFTEMYRYGKKNFAFILKQSFIKHYGEPVTQKEVEKDLSDRGLSYNKDTDMFMNDDYIIGDTHQGNVLRSKNGNLIYIDPIIELNTPEAGYGGKRKLSKISSPVEKSFKDELQKALKKAEDKIVNLSYEHAYCFDKDGNELFNTTDNNPEGVILHGYKDKLESSIFTHNHPKGDAFSINDIHVCLANNISEYRAVTNKSIRGKGVYILENKTNLKIDLNDHLDDIISNYNKWFDNRDETNKVSEGWVESFKMTKIFSKNKTKIKFYFKGNDKLEEL